MNFAYLTKKLTVVSIIITISFLFSSCEKESTLDSSKKILPERKYSLQNPPELEDEYDGSFYCLKSSWKISLSQYEDTTVNNKSFDMETATYSTAYFADSEEIIFAEINGSEYDEETSGDLTWYIYNSPAINTNGDDNIFSYKLSSEGTTYHDTIAVNSPEIDFILPEFMDTISRLSNLTITWETSDYQYDYVQITLQGKPIVQINPVDTSFEISSFTVLTEDDGPYTIYSNELSGFVQDDVSLTINRGYYKEFTHENQIFLFIISTARRIDLKLE